MKLALHFGWQRYSGHVLMSPDGTSPGDLTGVLPWSIQLMDCGLLENSKIPDVPDGRVFWTCGGKPYLWYAFYWWDRSGDRRGNSHSGFYVRGFEFHQHRAAFEFACQAFPEVMKRQLFPLVLQER